MTVTASLFLATPRLHADDKDQKSVEKAKKVEKTFRESQVQPPKESSGTAKSDANKIAKTESDKQRAFDKANARKDLDKSKIPDKIK